MQGQDQKIKKVFLSATYEDQVDCIEEIKSKLAERRIKVHHFKQGDFHDGRLEVHPHDFCIEKVKKIPNYLLIVSFMAGANHEGNNDHFRELTVTHAEFKAAYDAYNENRRLFCFIRRKVSDSYNFWKTCSKRNKVEEFWPAEQKVYRLLEDMEMKKVWKDTFEHSLELKELIDAKLQHFVEG